MKFVNSILPGWNFAENYNFYELGKIWVVWHPSVQVTVLHTSLQYITSQVQLPNQLSAFFVTIVYASNDDDLR